MPSSQRPSSPLEKFPPIEEEEGDDFPGSPLATKSGKHPPLSLWHPRKNGTIPRALGIGTKPQRPRKSISQAIGSMRTQSVSENAQEIADALRAPVSYKLIVRIIAYFCPASHIPCESLTKTNRYLSI